MLGRDGLLAVWSTDGIAHEERLNAWASVAAGVFGPITVHYDGPGPFEIRARMLALGPVRLLELSGRGHRIVRSSAPAEEEAASRSVFVNVQLAGRSVAHGRRVSLTTSAGRIGLISAPWPSMVELPDDFHQLIMTMPVGLLEPRLVNLDAAYGSTASDEASAALILSRVSYLIENGADLTVDAARLAGFQLVELIALAFGALQGPSRQSRPQQLLQGALDEIERQVADSTLSAEQVATHVNISVRYLQRLLANHGTTFGRWLNERRVERCCRDFDADPDRSRPIAAIAISNGFSDPARFSRIFRAQLGMSAREYRAAIAERVPSGPTTAGRKYSR